MDTGVPYGDIIVIAAVAAFVILRYRAMLGEPRGRDEGGPVRPAAQPAANPLEGVVQRPAARAQAPEKKPEDHYRETYGILAETLVAMRALDREFAPEEFLNGAKTAYEMVLTAYSTRDRDTLKLLLSEPLYQQFDQGMAEEQARGRRTDTTLVSITSATLAGAQLSGNQATVSVAFTSDQIHLVRDEAGVVIEGDASTQHKIEDAWTFTRDLKNSSPNWLIVAM